MNINPDKEIQRVRFGNQIYVLVREGVYDNLLRRLDSSHAALQLHRTRGDVSADLLETLVKERLTAEQVTSILREPTLGRRIALVRQFRGIDQITLARGAGVSQSTISKLEGGETVRPSFELIHRIMEVLDLPDIVSYALLRKDSVAAGDSERLARA